jgi:hypothetical protein
VGGEQTVTGEHVLSDVAVGAIDSKADVLQIVSGIHARLEVVVGAIVS